MGWENITIIVKSKMIVVSAILQGYNGKSKDEEKC